MHGAKFAHTNDDLSDEQFDGLISVTEDWHARVTLLRVSANCIVYLELHCCNSSLFGSAFYKDFIICKRHTVATEESTSENWCSK